MSEGEPISEQAANPPKRTQPVQQIDYNKFADDLEHQGKKADADEMRKSIAQKQAQDVLGEPGAEKPVDLNLLALADELERTGHKQQADEIRQRVTSQEKQSDL